MGAWPLLTDEPVPGLRGPYPLGPACSLVAESPAVYRPRRPERTVFYRLLEEHFDSYASVHEDRFEPRSGPLRPVVRKTVEQFLDCGRLHGGFARLRCPSCKAEHLLAFSCRSRNFCPSCQAKRAALFAEKLRHEILQPVPHRHIVFTIPKALRGLFERERRLLSVLSRSAYDALHEVYARALGRNKREVRPGFVASIQSLSLPSMRRRNADRLRHHRARSRRPHPQAHRPQRHPRSLPGVPRSRFAPPPRIPSPFPPRLAPDGRREPDV